MLVLIYSLSATDGRSSQMSAKLNACKTAPTWVLRPSVRPSIPLFLMRSYLTAAPCRAPVKMRCPPPPPPPAAAAAVLAVLSVLLRLDVLFAQQAEVKQSGGSGQGDRPGATKKSQPHIVFILIDDQVGPAGTGTTLHHGLQTNSDVSVKRCAFLTRRLD